MPKHVDRYGEGDHVQSVLFNKQVGWTKKKAVAWLKRHDHYTDGLDETTNYLRYRQVEPEEDKFRYRNEVIERKKGENSIILVNAYPKGGKEDDE